MSNTKCVLIIDQYRPVGVVANTAAVLSMTIGRRHPDLIGRDLLDSAGDRHAGITTAPIPILKGTATTLQSLRAALRPFEPELTVVDLMAATQVTRSYEEYARHLQQTPQAQQEILGLALCGDARLVNRFTGSLGLLRETVSNA